MTRFVVLDRGEALGLANYRELRSATAPVRLKLLDPAPPFRAWQIVTVRPGGADAARPGALLLCRDGDAFGLRWRDDARRRDLGEVVGRVVAAERGPTVVSLERGLLAHLPRRWLPRALDALEVLGRLRHPLTPPLFLGSAAASLAGVREKYDAPHEVREYAALARAGLETSEREIVASHVTPGGRLLDVGCGAGREALGLARAGFRVVAIDLAPGMIEAARVLAAREGLAITFRVQSATEVDDPPGAFDGAYFAGSYQHIPTRALRVQALRRIGRALTRDGVLILMVVYSRGCRGLLSRSRMVDALRRAGARLARRPLSEPGDGYMREVSEASDPRAPCFFHDFAAGPGEVAAEVAEAGLSGQEVAPGWWLCRPAGV